MAAAHGFKPVFGHTEPKRGAECWGEAFLVTFGALPKVTRRKGVTLSGRYRRNGYVLDLIQHPGRLSGRHGSKLPRHRYSVPPLYRLTDWHQGKPSRPPFQPHSFSFSPAATAASAADNHPSPALPDCRW
ncbi:hypothetical protein E4T65_00540 [Pseudomonas fluorescens]|uniref:Uncharacterized protein n=1 Tax=Pseudomonas fluorescens TaxID=294 RepID=A0A4Y9TL43_PSEFL|nr:hypothetical protein E4T65_00540 [Pseudomonas fluorescens]